MRTYRILGYGIDTFVFWLTWGDRYALPLDFVEKLDELLEVWREGGNPVIDVSALRIPNLDGGFFESALLRSGRKFRWMLLFPGLSVSLSRPGTRNIVHAYVEVSGSYMRAHNGDVQSVVRRIVEALTGLVRAEPVGIYVSRADLYSDVESAPLSLTDIECFTSRARTRKAYLLRSSWGKSPPDPYGGPPASSRGGRTGRGGPGEEEGDAPPIPGLTGGAIQGEVSEAVYFSGRRWTGFVFGSGHLLCRVYHKSAQPDPGAQALTADYGVASFVRVEFQIRGEALASMTLPGSPDLREFDTFLKALPAIWTYLTSSWLVMRRSPSYDSPPSDFWRAVMSAFGSSRPVIRYSRPPLIDASKLSALALGSLRAFYSVVAPRSNPRDFYELLEVLYEFLGVRKRYMPSYSSFSKRLAFSLARYSGLSLAS